MSFSDKRLIDSIKKPQSLLRRAGVHAGQNTLPLVVKHRYTRKETKPTFFKRMIDLKHHVAMTWRGIQIIKTHNGTLIPHEEPLFLLRGRDYLALPLLRHYLKLSAEDGCTGFHIKALNELLDRFEDFAHDYPERMKQPGITKGL